MLASTERDKSCGNGAAGLPESRNTLGDGIDHVGVELSVLPPLFQLRQG